MCKKLVVYHVDYNEELDDNDIDLGNTESDTTITVFGAKVKSRDQKFSDFYTVRQIHVSPKKPRELTFT